MMEGSFNQFDSTTAWSAVKELGEDAAKLDAEITDLGQKPADARRELEAALSIQERMIALVGRCQSCVEDLDKGTEALSDREFISSFDVETRPQLQQLQQELQKVRAFVHKTELKLAVCLKALTRADKTEKIRHALEQPEQLSINDQIARLQKLTKECNADFNVEAFKRLMGRYTGSRSRRFFIKDFDTLAGLRKLFEALKESSQVSADSKLTLDSFNHLLSELEHTLINTFERQLQVALSHKPLALQQAMKGQSGGNQDFQFACHDLYWDLMCPLEAHFRIGELVKLYSNPPQLLAEVIKKYGAQRESLQQQVTALGEMRIVLRQYAESSEVINAHKLAYLQGVLTANMGKWKGKAPQVAIFGAGPGGLMRALALFTMGARVRIFEKEANILQRWQRVHIGETSLMRYFGVTDRLRVSGSIEQTDEGSLVSIMDLQAALRDTLHDLLNTEPEERCEVADVTVGRSKAGIETGCLVVPVTEAGKRLSAEWVPADLVVDATGAHAAVAKILGNPRTALTKPSMMVTALFEITQERQPRSPPQNPNAGNWLVAVDRTPQRAAIYIQPDPDLQGELLKLHSQNRDLQQSIDRLSTEGEAERAKKEEELQYIGAQLNNTAKRAALEALRRVGATALKPGEYILESSVRSSAVRVQTATRQPVVMLDKTMIVQTGDALMTAEPRSMASLDFNFGHVHALITTVAAFKDPESTPEQRYRNHVFASEQATSRLMKKVIDLFGPESSLLKVPGFEELQFKDSGLLTEQQVRVLRALVDRADAGQNMASASEKRTLREIRKIWVHARPTSAENARLKELLNWFKAA